tara:strand:+ start:2129 stop:2380 length:252 start_codon:yes stop_codon:yes gene_type:complete
MRLKIKKDLSVVKDSNNDLSTLTDRLFSKDYVDFLNEAGWRLERKLPSNSNHYSDLLEDTEWECNNRGLESPKHFRRDLDSLS